MTTFRRSVLLTAALLLVAIGATLTDAQSTFLRATRFVLDDGASPSAAQCEISSGSGTPEGAVTGNVCDVYLRTDGGSGTIMYLKTAGTGNTNWETAGTGAGGGGGTGTVTVTRKSADESVTSSDVLQDDDDFSFAVGANETWVFHGVLYLDAATAGDLKVGLTVPASATYRIGLEGLVTTATGSTGDVSTTSSTSTSVTVGGAGSGTVVPVLINALVENSSTAGNVVVQWAQGTSDSTASTLKEESFVAASPEGNGSSTIADDINTSDTEANRAAAATEGRLFFPTNGVAIARDTGAAWTRWGPTFPLTDPTAKTWSWINQGTATVTETAESIYLSIPSNATLSIRGRAYPAPSTPYTITAAIMATNISPSAGDQWVAVGWADATPKLVLFQAQLNDTPLLNVVKYTNATTLSAGYSSAANNFVPSTPLWLRIADNGTNRICSYSVDGQHFVVYHTVTRTDFLTPTQVLFAANSDTSSYGMAVTLLSWKQE